MFDKIFSCCGNYSKPIDIELSQKTQKEKNTHQNHQSLNKLDNNKYITKNIINKNQLSIINSTPDKLKLILANKPVNLSPSLLVNLNSDNKSNNMTKIISNEKMSNNDVLLSYYKNQKSSNNNNNFNNTCGKVMINNNLSIVNHGNSFLTSLLNESKNDISFIKDIENRKKLILSGDLFFGNKVKITPNGIENKMTKRKERSTVFGIEDLYDFKGNPYNDYLINIKEGKNTGNINKNSNNNILNKNDKKKFVDEEYSTSVFKIIYNEKKDDYKLEYMHNSLLLYYIVKDKIFLNINKIYYFILGQVIISVYIKKEKNQNYIINIKIEGNKEHSKKYTFSQENTPIKLGRINCTINLDLLCISKLHCIIYYSKEDNVFYFKDNSSTNGSLMIVDDSIHINGKMNFKLEKSSFLIEEEI